MPPEIRPKEGIFKLGVVGLASWYSNAFIGYTNMLRWVKVVAAADLGYDDDYIKKCIGLSKDEYRKCFRVKLYESPSEMIREEGLDGVFICTENSKHAEYAELAMKEGVHVFIAKPFATNLKDADRILRAVEKSGVIVTTSSPARYDKMIRLARKMVGEGAIGQPIMVRAMINHHTITTDWPPWQLDHEKEGGPEVILGFYTCDLVRWFANSEPKRIYAESWNFTHPELPYIDNMKAIVRFNNDVIASMDMYLSIDDECPFPLWEVEVIGKKGCVRTAQDPSGTTLFTPNRQEGHKININPVLCDEIASWINCCIELKQPEFTIRDARAVLEMCLACKQSAESGSAITLPLKAE